MQNTVMAYPRANRQYALIVDASTGTPTMEGGLGAILTQITRSGNHKVIAYTSRLLAKQEKNYTPYLLEMEACVWAMEYFQEH